MRPHPQAGRPIVKPQLAPRQIAHHFHRGRQRLEIEFDLHAGTRGKLDRFARVTRPPRFGLMQACFEFEFAFAGSAKLAVNQNLATRHIGLHDGAQSSRRPGDWQTGGSKLRTHHGHRSSHECQAGYQATDYSNDRLTAISDQQIRPSAPSSTFCTNSSENNWTLNALYNCAGSRDLFGGTGDSAWRVCGATGAHAGNVGRRWRRL